MQTASVFFAVSFVGLTSMIVARLSSLKSGRPGLFSFLSRFDTPIANFLVRSTAGIRFFSAFLWRKAIVSLEGLHHLIASILHFLIQTAERRVRAWREFARTRKVVRREASSFIKDVVEYKRELKQNGREQ